MSTIVWPAGEVVPETVTTFAWNVSEPLTAPTVAVERVRSTCPVPPIVATVVPAAMPAAGATSKAATRANFTAIV